MARGKKDAPPGGASKRKIEQYDHRKAQRKNNPPVGLVTEASRGGSLAHRATHERHH